jgi:hypothetical protein
MENVTRRRFVQGTAAIVAGAAVGVTPSKSVRKQAPVEMRMYFFSGDPIVIKGMLYSDERQDRFGIKIYSDDGREELWAELRLSIVRESVASPSKTIRGPVTVRDWHGRTEEHRLSLIAADGNLTILMDEPGRPPSPAWMPLVDVKRVL